MSRLRTLLLLLPATLTACDCGSPPGGDAGPGGTVVINEICADNETINTDEAGDFDDWIELYNPGEAAADLSGFFLTDDRNVPTRFRFPDGTTVAAGGFLLIFADGEPAEGPLHADFRLSKDGEELILTDPDGTVVDEVVFGAQFADRTEGRTPDGEGGLVLLETPTPEGPNSGPGEPPDPPVEDAGPPVEPAIGVRLNEVLALPAAPTDDLAGNAQTAGWVELFNTTAATLDLRQHSLALDGTAVPIHPDLAQLGPFGHLVLFATGDPSGGVDHLGFTLPASGALELRDPDGQALDTLSYGPAVRGVSQGIVGEALVELDPTPGAPNAELPLDGGPQNSDAGDVGDAG